MIEKFWNKTKQRPTDTLCRVFKLASLPSPHSLLELTKLAQQNFMRPTKKKRWDLHDSIKYLLQTKSYFKAFRNLGLIDPILPSHQDYESLLILGTGTFDFLNRLHYGLQLPFSNKTIYLLAGERPLNKKEMRRLPRGLTTENQMMEYFAHEKIPKNRPWQMISVPMKEQGRPNTKDTIIAWLQTNPARGRHLLVSSQPFGLYQYLVSKDALSSDTSIAFDIAASSSVGNNQVTIYLDTIARILFELCKIT